MDRKKEQVERYQYEFDARAARAPAAWRATARAIAPPAPRATRPDHAATTRPKSTWRMSRRCGKACAAATTTRSCCARLSSTPYSGKASDLFRRVQQASPSPYEFLLQFGDEQLVGASPEMFVRVEGGRVETCPISGTAQRTGDPLRDADNIRELLSSAKEESELTMCTDVDRNDKSRVCRAGHREGDRPAPDRKLRRRLPHRGPRRGHSSRRASIRSTRSSATCGR